MPTRDLATLTFYVALSLTTIGGILELRRWAFAAEQARLGALGVAGVVLFVRGDALVSVAAALVGISVPSLVALVWQRHAFITPSDERMDLHAA